MARYVKESEKWKTGSQSVIYNSELRLIFADLLKIRRIFGENNSGAVKLAATFYSTVFDKPIIPKGIILLKIFYVRFFLKDFWRK